MILDALLEDCIQLHGNESNGTVINNLLDGATCLIGAGLLNELMNIPLVTFKRRMEATRPIPANM